MILSLQKVLPLSIPENFIHNSPIWGNMVNYDKNQVYVIQAHSGKGKSTFIKLITGLQRPKSGKILFGHHELTPGQKDRTSLFKRNHLSTVYQDLQLIPDIKAIDNILINFPDKNFINNELDELIKRFRIDHVMNHLTYTLSFGERQRIAIVRAMAKNYDWLIMDEPFSHLDFETAQIAFNALKENARRKKAGVIITSLGNESFLQKEQIVEL